MIILLRGTLRIMAALAGLLLFYGVIYAMDGMTTRVPTSAIRDLATSTLWMVPLALMFCSGFDDFAAATRREWTFWSGSTVVMFLIYYFERNTASHGATKALMPLLVVVGGVLPHVFRRMSLLYTACSICAGICGIVVLYYVFPEFLSPQTHFANKAIAMMIVTFITASVGAGILSLSSCLYVTRAAA